METTTPFIRHPSRPPSDSQHAMRRSQSTGRDPADLHQGHPPPVTLPVRVASQAVAASLEAPMYLHYHPVPYFVALRDALDFLLQLRGPCVSVARKAARAPGVMANALHVGARTRSTSLVAVRLSPLCAHTTSFSISVEKMPARTPPLIGQRSVARQIDSFEHCVSPLVPELIHVLRGLCMLQLGSLLLLAWVGVNKPRDTPAPFPSIVSLLR